MFRLFEELVERGMVPIGAAFEDWFGIDDLPDHITGGVRNDDQDLVADLFSLLLQTVRQPQPRSLTYSTHAWGNSRMDGADQTGRRVPRKK